MAWYVELVSSGPDVSSRISFARGGENVLLHLHFDRPHDRLAISRRDALGWLREVHCPLPASGRYQASLYMSLRPDAEGRLVIAWRGGEMLPDWVRFEDLLAAEARAEGMVVWHRTPGGAHGWLRDWRLQRAPSGFPAGNRALRERIAAGDTARGATFLIRARNEAPTIGTCLRTIAGLADEIVFVDNNSADETQNIAERAKAEIFELKTFSYPHDIPKAGAEHAREVFAGASNTLGHYYNWCLARAGRANVIKWDADYIAIRPHLAEMIRTFDLRTREDAFVLWFSGLEVYTDGHRYWVDTESAHSEFRAFSLKHGCHWVDLPPWEEIDQSFFFAAQKLFWRKPVYLELFRLDEIEFRDRGLFADDTRDRERLSHIRMFTEHGTVPAHFLPIADLNDPVIMELPLSSRELELSRYFDSHFRCAPRLRDAPTGTAIEMDVARQDDVAVLVVSCAPNAARRDAIRETWGADLIRLGIPLYFIIGRPGEEARIVGDTLYLDVPDTYEFLATKVVAALEFSLARLNVSYVFKIDDDCVLHPFRFLHCEYRDADFVGGGIAGGPGSVIDWHVGKCANEQLDRVVFFRERDAFWIGGQYGYFLSVEARRILVEQRAAVRRSLYEDYVMAKVLRERGIRARAPFGDMISLKWHEDTWQGRDDVVLVADVPDAATMRAVHARLVGGATFAGERARAAERTRVIFDWLDFEAMRAKLAGD